MSKKGKNHETQAADVVADPILPAVPAEHDEPASAALVAGDGGDAAGATGGEYPGEPPAATGEADSASLGDGAGGTDTETEGQAEEGLAPAALHESEGLSDDASEGAGEGEGDASGDQLGAITDTDGRDDTGGPGGDGGQGDSGSDEHGQHPGSATSEGAADPGTAGIGGGAATLDPAAGDGATDGDGHSGARAAAAVGTPSSDGGEDAGGPRHNDGTADGGKNVPGQHAGAGTADGAVDAGGSGFAGGPAQDPDGHTPSDRDPGEPAVEEWTLDRVALCGAVGAYQEALIHGAWLAAKIRGTDPRALETSDAVYDDMAAFVRQIGERATPDVLAQQLVIKKHRKSAEISQPERIALGVFSSVLLGLDRHIAQERERIAQEEAVAAPRPPVPTEETTMELVDAPMATWGGRG